MLVTDKLNLRCLPASATMHFEAITEEHAVTLVKSGVGKEIPTYLCSNVPEVCSLLKTRLTLEDNGNVEFKVSHPTLVEGKPIIIAGLTNLGYHIADVEKRFPLDTPIHWVIATLK